jgi:UDP-2,3-diacylglucosamine pyrophosphatase LpxH
MKHNLLILYFLLQSTFFYAQPYKPFSLFLIGDAGEDTASGKALLRLKDSLLKYPNSAVVFLGDNVYPAGLNVKDTNSIKRMESQLKILNEYKGQVYFIPGNHDWSAQKTNGIKVLRAQQDYVTFYLKNKTTVKNKDEKTFLPENALPGPETVMLNEYLRLIIIDTQWFLHSHKKNKLGTKSQTKKMFYKRLDSILAYADVRDEKVIIAAHHPVYTNGAHSRKLQPWRFLVNYTPFQVFGVLGLNRLFSQDIEQPRYKKMRKDLLKVFNKYPDKITYVCGHDHNLQLINKDNVSYIVSGGGSKLSKLRNKKISETLYAQDESTGFVEVLFDEKRIAKIVFNAKEPTLIIEKQEPKQLPK